MNGSDAIALNDTISRTAKILANRRALALLLKHHGDRPPEAGCSAEAIAIRAQLRDRAGRNGARRQPARPLTAPVDQTIAKAGIEAIVDAVAGQYGIARDALLASHVHMSPGALETRAFQEVCWHALKAGASVSSVARVLGRDRASVRYSARRHAERLGAGAQR